MAVSRFAGWFSARWQSITEIFRHNLRVFILIVSTLAMTFTMSNPLVLNFAIICMVKQARSNLSIPALSKYSENVTLSSNFGIFEWSVSQRSTALSAFAWGATASIMPLSWLMQRYGCRTVFLVASILSSAATLLCPIIAVKAPFALFIGARIIQGFGYAAALPMLAMMTSRWAGARESAQFLALGTCCIQFSPIITMPIGGMACMSSYGWPLAFYITGILCLAMSGCWFLLYTDLPLKHFWISAKEAKKIAKDKHASSGEDASEGRHARKVPFRALFSSKAIWAILIATFGNMFGIQLIITFMPMYLRQVMAFDIRSTGFLSATPHIGLAISKTVAGVISDKTKCCGPCSNSETFKVRLFNAIAFVGMSGCYFGFAFMTTRNGYLALGLFTLGATILGFNVGSFFKSATIVAQIYSGFAMGLVQLTTCITILILPYVVGVLTPHGSADEWMHVFIMVALLLLVTNGVFCVFGSGEPATWAFAPGPERPQIASVAYAIESRTASIQSISTQ